MPHKAAVCVYCQKAMAIERVHPTMTPYHGACRVAHLRHLWARATPAQRAHIEEEVACINASTSPPKE